MASRRPCLPSRKPALSRRHLEEATDGVDQPWPRIPLPRGRYADRPRLRGIAGGFHQIVFQIPVGEVEQVTLQVDDLHVGAHLHLSRTSACVVAGQRLGIEAQHPIRDTSRCGG